MTDKIAEGVGKRIVDALKQQSEMEIQTVVENPAPVEDSFDDSEIEYTNAEPIETSYEEEPAPAFESQNNYTAPSMMTFTQSSFMSEKENFASDLDDYDIPTNVAVLKQLINQLPGGVSRQTGAQIIKQTMEALGISMKSVLQEAQQVQENINNSSRECQSSIVEHRKQIDILERQSQKLQKQYMALNDIISLFVQTNI